MGVAPDADVVVRDNPTQQRFEIFVDGSVAGFVAYRGEGGALVLTHTEVDDDYEGQSLESKLVSAALSELRSVVPEAERARFGLA